MGGRATRALQASWKVSHLEKQCPQITVDIHLIIKTLMTGAVVVRLSGAAGTFGCEQPCVALGFKKEDANKHVGTCGEGKL